jgi:hypothetical protein
MSIDLSSYPACLGTLTIDWEGRRVEFKGMTGADDMTVDEVKAEIAAGRGRPGIKVVPLIFWLEDEQLSAHDEAGFEAELASDREVKRDEDEADIILKGVNWRPGPGDRT